MPTVPYFTLRAYNRDLLLDVEKTYLTAELTAVGASLTVESITGLGVGDYLLLGEFGQEKAEIVRIHTSTAPSGSTVTLTGNTTFTHERGTPIYRVDRNQVEFSIATTVTGSKTTLATQSIQADSLYSVYVDTTNTTGFGFYRFVNSGDTSYTNYSESIPYAGYNSQTLKIIFDSALVSLGLVDSAGQPRFTQAASREAAFQAVVDCQEELAGLRKRWSYLTDFNLSVSELSTGQDVYALPSTIAFENGNPAILAARIGSREDLKYIDKTWLNKRRLNVAKTTLGAAISATTATTITLTDSSDFDDSGSIQVVEDDGESIDIIAYTANNRSTNVLSGVTGIAATKANGAVVWQGATFGEPTHWTAFEDNIILDIPPDASWEQYNLFIDTYIRPTVVNDLADEAQFPVYVIKPYVTSRLAEILDDGPSERSRVFYQRYVDQRNVLLSGEQTGQFIRMKPSRLPDVTTDQRLQMVTKAESTNS